MDKYQERLIYIGMGIVLALILLRFMAAFRVIFFILIGAGLLTWLGIWAYRQLQRRKKKRIYGQSLAGRVDRQLSRINDLMDKNNAELEEIETSIQHIRRKQSKAGKLTVENQKELDGLLAGFQQEKKLREAKGDFFRVCEQKLLGMIANQNLADELKQSKQKLLELREDQYEDLAELESIRSDLETDIFYLDAIDELSEKMISSNSYESANSIQLELEKMAEELRR